MSIAKYAYDGADIVQDIKTKYGFEGDIVRLFAEHSGRKINKWHHYLPIYDRYFSQYRNTPVKFLEIGVAKGGSLHFWRKYFGADAVIYGIDINENCASFNGENGQVRIGSQDDPEFLANVVDEMGGVDVILDDGSHHMDHIPVSLEALFPKLRTNGVYMIEDLHCAFWQGFGGGVAKEGNFFNYVRKIFTDMHSWYHPAEPILPALQQLVSSVHVYDSIVVLEKSPVHKPAYSKRGRRVL